MKGSPPDEITAHVEGALGLERILKLETQLAQAPLISRQHRQLTKAIEIAAVAYRMILDNEQANATHDPNPLTGRATARRSPTRKLGKSKRSHS